MDIEGAESTVFDEVRPWMSMVDMIIIEIHPPFTLERFAATIEAAGFALALPGSNSEHQMIMAVRASAGHTPPGMNAVLPSVH